MCMRGPVFICPQTAYLFRKKKMSLLSTIDRLMQSCSNSHLFIVFLSLRPIENFRADWQSRHKRIGRRNMPDIFWKTSSESVGLTCWVIFLRPKRILKEKLSKGLFLIYRPAIFVYFQLELTIGSLLASFRRVVSSCGCTRRLLNMRVVYYWVAQSDSRVRR